MPIEIVLEDGIPKIIIDTPQFQGTIIGEDVWIQHKIPHPTITGAYTDVNVKKVIQFMEKPKPKEHHVPYGTSISLFLGEHLHKLFEKVIQTGESIQTDSLNGVKVLLIYDGKY